VKCSVTSLPSGSKQAVLSRVQLQICLVIVSWAIMAAAEVERRTTSFKIDDRDEIRDGFGSGGEHDNLSK
jgi:hypothetical protein